MEMFGWPCNVVLSGQTPFQDWLSSHLEGGGQDHCPDGFRACLVQARGEWEWMVMFFWFPAVGSATHVPLLRCVANRSRVPRDRLYCLCRVEGDGVVA